MTITGRTGKPLHGAALREAQKKAAATGMNADGNIARGPGWELHHGAWQDTMIDRVWCTLLLGDPGYSERTHEGRRTGSEVGESEIPYAPLTEEEARELAQRWKDRVREWVVLSGDHETWAMHEAAWKDAGYYTFAPVPWFKTDAPPRFQGDGPASVTEWIFVARPVCVERGGSRRGKYEGPCRTRNAGKAYPGQKPLWLARQLVHDYSRAGGMVCDPYVGTGAYLEGALDCGRRAVGAERERPIFDLAVSNLRSATMAQVRSAVGKGRQAALTWEE